MDGTCIVQNGSWVQGRYGWQSTIGEYNGLNFPPYSFSITLVYSGNNMITLFTRQSAIWSYNITSNQWATIIPSGIRIYEDYNVTASRSEFQVRSASNNPGARLQYGYPQTLGSLWIVRGNATADGDLPADTFVYSIDICGSDLAPSCSPNSACVDKIGYAECRCDEGYESDGVTCQKIVIPSPEDSFWPANNEGLGSSPLAISRNAELVKKVIPGVLVPVAVLAVAIPFAVVCLKRRKSAAKKDEKSYEDRSSSGTTVSLINSQSQ